MSAIERRVLYASFLLDLPLGIAIYLLGTQVLAVVLAVLMLALLLAQSHQFIVREGAGGQA